MKEYYVKRTISLSQSNGVIHIEAEVDDWQDEERTIYLEWDANAMLDDIPALYEFASKAKDAWEKSRQQKYKELKKKL
jgi:hypothetical protein